MYISKKRRAGVLTDQNWLQASMGTNVVPMEQMWYRRLINIWLPFILQGYRYHLYFKRTDIVYQFRSAALHRIRFRRCSFVPIQIDANHSMVLVLWPNQKREYRGKQSFHFNSLSPKKIAQKEQDFDKDYIYNIEIYINVYDIYFYIYICIYQKSAELVF